MLAVVLDDLEVRHQAFREKYGAQYSQIERCYNLAQFVHFVLSYPGSIDHISLDHDLGDYEGGNVLFGNGMDAVRLLINLPESFRPKTLNVHSHNYVCQERMIYTLTGNGFPEATVIHFTED